VLVLTARAAVEDKVAGLDLGADDYLVKPFDLAELEARLRALIRRGTGGTGSVIEMGNLRYDMDGRRVTIDQQPADLSARELAVFEYLVLRAGRVVSKEQLVDHLCERGEAVYLNAIEVYVYRLRKKLAASPVTIRTVRGLGYLLEKPRGG
jgi:DNA-binding response OmpR family regulator